MTAGLAQQCREYFAGAYRQQLDQELSSSPSMIAKERTPAWMYVSSDDLTSTRDPFQNQVAGLVLDPEVGVLCYVIPFEDSKRTRSQAKRAMALRSQLLAEHRYEGKPRADSDPHGSWRIALHWLTVTTDEANAWLEAIERLRRDTGFTEEISLDHISVCNANIKGSLEEHGFPRLLLTMREVLRKTRDGEVNQWMSANQLVRNALRDLPNQFHDAGPRKCANVVAEAVQAFVVNDDGSGTHSATSESPRGLKKLSLRHFRNFEDFELLLAGDPVSTTVIHGPNGTGKSSLCEALSIGLFETSSRFARFADRSSEKDVAATDRVGEYIRKYLLCVHHPQQNAQLAINDDAVANVRLADPSTLKEAHLKMSGTILTQDMSLDFARMSADDLGAQVLRGYSDIAKYAEDMADRELATAETTRKDFLRTYGISAQVTKISTAYAKIARRELDNSAPSLNPLLVEWCDSIAGAVPGIAANNLAQRWREWGGNSARDSLAESIAAQYERADHIRNLVQRWLDDCNEIVIATAEIIGSIESRIGHIRNEIGTAVEQISAWGQWLEKRRDAVIHESTEVSELAKPLVGLRARQQEIIERGRLVRGQLDHLKQIEAYIRETWSKQHLAECPTCGADHSTDGGIVVAFETVLTKATAVRQTLLDEHEQIKKEIEGTQRRLAELGSEQCPLAGEEQSQLAEWFGWLVPNSSPLEQWIAIPEQRERLLAAVRVVRSVPPLPVKVESEAVATKVADDLTSQFRSAAAIWEAPSNWKPVRDTLLKMLANIVNEHLPNTLQKLWLEFVFNLTSAPWLLLSKPCLEATTRRGDQKVSVRIKDRLARYMLNESEIHILGLAWFFTQYLSQGRFHHSCMIMDDPAHELDQTSFRELCRLWETMVRLHKVYERPLTLVIMLHQENRAIEAARATGGVLAVLGWNKDQSTKAETMRIVDEGFYPPQPNRLFEPVQT